MASQIGFGRLLAPDARFRIGDFPSGDRAVDFWDWAFGRLGNNAICGVLAEFIVARALGIELDFRDDWANHDFKMTDGMTIEVRSSAWRETLAALVTNGRPGWLKWGVDHVDE